MQRNIIPAPVGKTISKSAVRRSYTPSEANLERQRSRLQVRVSRPVKETLVGTIIKDREGVAALLAEATRMELIEAFALLECEPLSAEKTVTVTVTPNKELLARARHFHIPPHILVRAAAVKLALNLITAPGVNGGVVVGKQGPITDTMPD